MGGEKGDALDNNNRRSSITRRGSLARHLLSKHLDNEMMRQRAESISLHTCTLEFTNHPDVEEVFRTECVRGSVTQFKLASISSLLVGAASLLNIWSRSDARNCGDAFSPESTLFLPGIVVFFASAVFQAGTNVVLLQEEFRISRYHNCLFGSNLICGCFHSLWVFVAVRDSICTEEDVDIEVWPVDAYMQSVMILVVHFVISLTLIRSFWMQSLLHFVAVLTQLVVFTIMVNNAANLLLCSVHLIFLMVFGLIWVFTRESVERSTFLRMREYRMEKSIFDEHLGHASRDREAHHKDPISIKSPIERIQHTLRQMHHDLSDAFEEAEDRIHCSPKRGSGYGFSSAAVTPMPSTDERVLSLDELDEVIDKIGDVLVVLATPGNLWNVDIDELTTKIVPGEENDGADVEVDEETSNWLHQKFEVDTIENGEEEQILQQQTRYSSFLRRTHSGKLPQPSKIGDKSFDVSNVGFVKSGPFKARKFSLGAMSNLSSTLQSKYPNLVNEVDWNLDILTLKEETNGYALYVLSSAVLFQHDFINIYNIDVEKLNTFLLLMEEGYDDLNNPYHNSCHGADVLNSVNCLLADVFLVDIPNCPSACGYRKDVENSFSIMHKSLDTVHRLAMVISAIAHDFKHPGTDNNFQIAASTTLAILYSDKSISEHHHIAQLFFLLKNEKSNILQNLTLHDYKVFRSTTIHLILATDLSKHFELVSHLKAMVIDQDRQKSMKDGSYHSIKRRGSAHSMKGSAKSAGKCTSFGDPAQGPLFCKGILNMAVNQTNANNALETLLQTAIKIADIGHVSKRNSIHQQWTEMITKEFFEQGDEERRRGMKVSAFMDRDHVNLVKSQIGFFKFVCLPLYEVFCNAMPAGLEYKTALDQNMKYWVDQEQTGGERNQETR